MTNFNHARVVGQLSSLSSSGQVQFSLQNGKIAYKRIS